MGKRHYAGVNITLGCGHCRRYVATFLLRTKHLERRAINVNQKEFCVLCKS